MSKTTGVVRITVREGTLERVVFDLDNDLAIFAPL